MTRALDYHQSTKHSFNRFARSLGYLDWAAQPDPFRRYEGAGRIDLPRAVLRGDVSYSALFDRTAAPAPVNEASVGEFLRCSLGLSAWKQYQASRWALRVNPSSGNLHPTEAYIVWNGRVCHYAPREHALEIRATLQGSPSPFLVGLTSIPWREAWKYGERAFRYCQHDVGHAVGALRFAAALLGWHFTLLSDWSDGQIAALLGTERDGDYAGVEREEPECLALVGPDPEAVRVDADTLVRDARATTWAGTANRLSRSHVEWPVIDEVAAGTRKERGQGAGEKGRGAGERGRGAGLFQARGEKGAVGRQSEGGRARQIILQRRSALGFEARSSLPRDTFISMLRKLLPGPADGRQHAVPWDAIDWPPQVHLAIFVHRVEGLTPGLYAFVRDAAAIDDLRAAMRPEFLWERSSGANDLFLLVPTDVRFTANRLSCDQDIAADGFFSLGMIARTEPALRERGDWFYRRLFWECGLIGQVLYLEAEAAGARATGIGCFYDDAVHDVLGLTGMTWQSLYHFSMGVPVDDGRLTSEPGYPGGW